MADGICHGLLSMGVDLGMASTPIWEYPRTEPILFGDSQLGDSLKDDACVPTAEVGGWSIWMHLDSILVKIMAPGHARKHSKNRSKLL